MMRRTRFPQYFMGVVGMVICLAVATAGAALQAQTSTEPPLISQNASTLEGLPTVRVDASKEGATRRTLNGAEATRQSLG